MKASAKKDLVLSTIIMRLTTEQALEYIKDQGYSISRSNFFRIKGQLKKDKLKRLYNYAKGFEEFHLSIISEIEEIRRLMWENYHKEQNPSKKVVILKEIKETAPYYSAYIEATKNLLEHKKIQEVNSKKKKKPLAEIEQEEEINNDEST